MEVTKHKTGRPNSYLVFLLIGFLVFLLQFSIIESANVYKDHIDAGSEIGPYINFVDYNGVFLQSENGTFVMIINATYGSANIQGGTYYLCIMHQSSKVIVWVANRETPGSSSDAVEFSKEGKLQFGSNPNVLWSSDTTNATTMRLLEKGNLVLLDAMNHTVWESFDHPSDTLLEGQVIGLKPSQKLVSTISSTNMSLGPYSLSFDSAKGNLELLFSGLGDPIEPYWSMASDTRIVTTSSGSPAYAVFNSSALNLVNNKGSPISQINFGPGTLARATLGPDGNLQIYVFNSGLWTTVFQSSPDKCQLPFYCGYLNICGANAQCTCPGKLSYLDPTNANKGCAGSTLAPCFNNYSSPSAQSSNIYDIDDDGLDYFAAKYISPLSANDLDSCKKLCLHNCSCIYGLFYSQSGHCFLFPHLGTLTRSNSNSSSGGAVLFVKSDRPLTESSQQIPSFLIPVIIVGTTFVILAIVGAFAYRYFKVRKLDLPDEYDLDDDPFLDSIPGLPTRFSFKDLQNATDNFSKKLGTGGFGSVYEGQLPNDKTKIAVKRLENIGQGKKEFQSEVTIIGSIHHFHLVQLRGFCSEGLHRLLVYEFMSNGSLDKRLFVERDSKHFLDWSTRCKIALGTARGLAYLHNDCREKVIHCDIKPENILLDDNFSAKVSDFGLAKLINKEQSQIFTTMRGTRGYLAPEWLMNLPISEKSDVYSFGMVLLEIISGRKNYEPSETFPEKRYFPAYAFQQAEKGFLEDVVDERLKGTTNKAEVMNMVKIALWCIQEESHLRPSMTKVVQMLNGETKVDDPPSSEMVMRFNTRIVDTSSSSNLTSSTSDSSYLLSAVEFSAIQLSSAR